MKIYFNKKFMISKENIIYLIFLLTPFVEMINSVILINNNGISPIGKLYRLIIYITILGLVFLGKVKKFLLVKLIYISSSILFIASTKYFVYFDKNYLMEAMKLLFPIFLILAFQCLYSSCYISSKLPIRILNMYSWIIPLTYLIPRFLGKGFYQYGTTGYKGYNYQLNDINIITICLFFFSLLVFFSNKNISNFIRSLLNTITLLSFSSKASMTMFCVIIIFFCFKYIFLSGRIYRIVPVIIGMFISMNIFISIFKEQILSYFNRVINMYKYMTAQGYSFWEFMSSSRSSRFTNVSFAYSIDNKHFFRHIFWGVNDITFPNTEMDIFDIFFTFGIVVACIVLLFYLKIFLNSVLYKIRIDYLFMYVMMLIYSTVAGHVLSSAYSGMFLANIAFLLIVQYQRSSLSCKN